MPTVPASAIYTHSLSGVTRMMAAHGVSSEDPFHVHAIGAAESVPEHQLGRFLDTVSDMLLFRRGLYATEEGLWSDFSGYSLPRGHLAGFNAHVRGMYNHGAPK